MMEDYHPLVSIVIPVYNGSNYMREAIDSALAQTYDNIEVIVVNDGSNDGGATEEIALSYGDRIRYFSKPNGGVATALNLGIKEMRGEYFSWLSHDDMYKPEKVEREIMCVRESGRPETVVAGGYDLMDAGGTVLYSVNLWNQYAAERLQNPLFVLLRGGINGCAMLIHRSHFERVGVFDKNLPTTQDYDLWFRMFRDCPFYYYRGEYVLSRWHDEQGSKKIVTHTAECDTLWIHMMEDLTDKERQAISGTEVTFFEEIYAFLSGTDYAGAIAYAREKIILLGGNVPESDILQKGNPVQEKEKVEKNNLLQLIKKVVSIWKTEGFMTVLRKAERKLCGK